MGKSKKQKSDNQGGFASQAISKADTRQQKTGVAQPSDENVQKAKNWVAANKK